MRYARLVQLLGCGLIVLWASSAHAQTLAQKKPQAYALGVSMGFASFQLQVATTQRADNHPAYDQARSSERRAIEFARSINDAAPNMLETQILERFEQISRFDSDEHYADWVNKGMYDRIVALRSTYSAVLSRVSADLANAYNLGVNLAIAEGQTTAGEPARQIVYASLINARTAAQALKLDMSELNVCIELTNGSTSLEEVRNRIQSVRTTYQSLL